MPSTPLATRVLRGWLAAGICTFTAFAAHAHAAPSALSLVVMALITCLSAVVAMFLVGRRFSLLATSIAVLLSQGLYHLAFSVMSHDGSGTVSGVTDGTHHHVTALSVSAGTASASTEPNMLYAHILAALISIVVLRQGETLVGELIHLLGLGAARLLLWARALEFRGWPRTSSSEVTHQPLQDRTALRLPLRRGPPSVVVSH
ncbi:hypothetical protein [Glutamicibacter sp. X7]